MLGVLAMMMVMVVQQQGDARVHAMEAGGASGGELSLYVWPRRAASLGAHLGCVALTVTLAALSMPGSSVFSWHPFLMSLGFCLFMTEAVLLFSPDCSPLRSWPRAARVRWHWVLQALAVTCAAAGLAAICWEKQRNGRPHFSSWHGLLGLITCIYVFVQACCGPALLYPKLLFKKVSLAKVKLYHATYGLLGYVLACTSVLLGLCSAWFAARVAGPAWLACAACPVLAALVAMNQVTNAYLFQKRVQL
ncbi:unnamed protein product [Lampetra fluviatilis]